MARLAIRAGALGLMGCAATAPPPSNPGAVAVPAAAPSAAPSAATAPTRHAIGEVTLSHLPAALGDSALHYARGKDDHLALDPIKVNICYQTALTTRPATIGWMLVQQRQEESAVALTLVEQEGLPAELVACVLQARSDAMNSSFSLSVSHLYLRFR